MNWKCKKPIGEPCPLDEKIPLAQDIMLVDCMTEDCPYLEIEGHKRMQQADTGNPCH